MFIEIFKNFKNQITVLMKKTKRVKIMLGEYNNM
jgi:hypothetical protein